MESANCAPPTGGRNGRSAVRSADEREIVTQEAVGRPVGESTALVKLGNQKLKLSDGLQMQGTRDILRAP
jgi:hypothetical protein